MFAALAAVVAAAVALGPDLYQGARAGMSEAEVLALFPDATPNREPTPQLEARRVVADRPAVVRFVFDHHALRRVVLDLERQGSLDDGAADFSALRLALTERYGPPAGCRAADMPASVELRCQWATAAGVAIKLTSEHVAGAAAFLNVDYEPAPTPAASGL